MEAIKRNEDEKGFLAIQALEAFQDAMKDEVAESEFTSEEEIYDFIKEIRDENPRRY